MNKFYIKIFVFCFFIQFVKSELKNSYSIKYSDEITCELTKCGNQLCSSNGVCTNNTCVCNPQYTSKNDDGIIKCCYKQKALMTAFYYELFGFGIGHKYVGNDSLFIKKLITYVVLLVSVSFFIVYCCFHKKENVKYFRNLLILIGGFIYIIWQIVDAVLFLSNAYTDNNKVDLFYQ